MINCWKIRFESIHSYFRNIISTTQNTINICKTMDERYQKKQSLHQSNAIILNKIHVF